MGNNGQILDDFTEIDYINKNCKDALVTKGKNLIEKLYGSTINGVFYE